MRPKLQVNSDLVDEWHFPFGDFDVLSSTESPWINCENRNSFQLSHPKPVSLDDSFDASALLRRLIDEEESGRSIFSSNYWPDSEDHFRSGGARSDSEGEAVSRWQSTFSRKAVRRSMARVPQEDVESEELAVARPTEAWRFYTIPLFVLKSQGFGLPLQHSM